MNAPFSPLRWDESLIKRYDLSGPRYTSYPTALQFRDCNETDYQAALAESERLGGPLSLYFHIPFCARLCYYCACNKIVTKRRERAQPYLDRLFKEMDLVHAMQSTRRTVTQLHWGGGTPTFLSDDQMVALMDKTASLYALAPHDEGDFSIEIDPREVTDTTLSTLRRIGFNRISFGVQDIDPEVQKAVNRIQPVELTERVVNDARALGFRSLNIDLIYGLPLQTRERFRKTVERVIELGPDRLSIFNYAHLPHRFDPQKRISVDDLPPPAEKLEMFHDTITALLAAGYVYIGMDHFAKPDDGLATAQQHHSLHRNFQGYTTHKECDLIAFGVSSISQIGSAYLQNHHEQEKYEASIDEGRLAVKRGVWLNDDDKIRRDLIMTLICHFSVNMAAFGQQHSISFRDYFRNELRLLEQHANDGLIRIDDEGLEVQPAGRLLIRAICQVFDRYQGTVGGQSFSRII